MSHFSSDRLKMEQALVYILLVASLIPFATCNSLPENTTLSPSSESTDSISRDDMVEITVSQLTDFTAETLLANTSTETPEHWEMEKYFFGRYNTTTLIDLVFVLDRSGSVPKRGWQSVIDFVKVITQLLIHNY